MEFLNKKLRSIPLGSVVIFILVIVNGANCEQHLLSNEVGVISGKHQPKLTSFVSSSLTPTSSNLNSGGRGSSSISSIATNPGTGSVSGGGAAAGGSQLQSGGNQHASAAVGEEQYRATYFYPAPHHPHQMNWNRDSYADAASEFGYNQQQQQSQQHFGQASAPGAVYAPAYGLGDSSAEGYDDSSFGGAGGGLGGFGGLAGLLGLKGIKGLGIKGLGILAIAKAAVPILAILLPGLLILPLLLLFFPVPVITVPATTRALALPNFLSSFDFGGISGKVSNLARSVLESDSCVERISCEVSSRVSRGSWVDRTVRKVIPKWEEKLPQTLRRIARVYMDGSSGSCGKKYNCYLMDDNNSSNSNSSNGGGGGGSSKNNLNN